MFDHHTAHPGSLCGLNEAYVTQTLRLIELEVAATRNMNMIDRFMQRMVPFMAEQQSAPRGLECAA